MTRALVAIPIVIVAVFGWNPANALAQDTQMTRGTITSLAGDSLTMRTWGHDMAFTVDGTTVVTTVGGSTKMRAAQKAGRPGPRLNELLRDGQSVEITYTKQSDQLHASQIRTISKLDEGDGDEHAAGTVTAVTGTALAIKGTSGKATFTQTFTIDPHTKVIGKGLGTMAAAKGGRIAITDGVAVGDSVGVWFHKNGDSLHASEVHVTKVHASSLSSSK